MTRPKEIPESSELCKDQIADNLLGFYAQVESFHNECLIGVRFAAVDSTLRRQVDSRYSLSAELRAQLELVERLSERLPPLVYKQLLVNSLADLQAALNSQLMALTTTDVEFEQRRVCYTVHISVTRISFTVCLYY